MAFMASIASVKPSHLLRPQVIASPSLPKILPHEIRGIGALVMVAPGINGGEIISINAEPRKKIKNDY